MLTVYNDDPHSKIREVISWGSFGEKGDQSVRFHVLKDMSTEHIKNILANITHIPDWRMAIFKDELEYRKVKNVS